ncbi:hypothetical protein [Chryseobacterium sp. MP_3.2]|uniref:hypothetical protein n=1 Tax=Chryseobacterium sp. MP_3.2 TaxID=3071712 RepID=UPI002DF8A319|nr:hypothetical protein [Chryseobacterium sp. MP_3.2]
MLYKLTFLWCMLLSIFGTSQVRNPDGVDFLEFMTSDFKYEVMLITDKISTNKTSEATIRIRYDDRIVEFYSIAEFELIDDSIFINVIPKDQEVKVIKGTSTYNPDTFLLILNEEGNFLKGEATDKNSTTGNKLKFTTANTFTDQLRLLKRFYESDDPLYPKIVKLLKDEFILE